MTDWVYIEDTIDGILAATTSQNPESKTLDLGSGVLTSVREIIENVVSIMKPKREPLFGALPDRYTEHTRIADIQYTFEKIGWKATTSLDNGLKRTIDYYLNN